MEWEVETGDIRGCVWGNTDARVFHADLEGHRCGDILGVVYLVFLVVQPQHHRTADSYSTPLHPDLNLHLTKISR